MTDRAHARTRWLISLAAAITYFFSPWQNLSAEIQFDRQIQPILSEHCFQCHGPDAEQRKAKLRLDTRQGLFGADGQGPFVPGQPDASEAIKRIQSADPDEQMPPPDAHLPLSSEKIELLTQWVREGAPWQRHWSFEPVRRGPLPALGETTWPRNVIDLFVHEQQIQQNLEPAPEAPRGELIRRLKLDLHGLPPSPQEVEAFVSDSRPDAYQRLLDRLLDSPRYGERMVWDWLDAARYADSNGYQADRERTMWPWRDWAVTAFNRNIPFNQFTINQIAGDLLPDPSSEEILATGFNRNHMINGEGGRIPEENRVDYVMDMAETVGTVWLGLTMNCCRCHDHKFDPLTQRDYYGLFAFFNQTPVTGGGGDPQTPPILELPTEQDRRRVRELRTRRQEQESAVHQSETKSLRSALTSANTELKKRLEIEVKKRQIADLAALIKAASGEHTDYVRQLKSLSSIKQELDTIDRRTPKVMVMRDQPQPRDTFILSRGLYNQPGPQVTAATPASLPAMPDQAPVNRLGLARWLVSPENPLTARVFVNRQWALFFGRGLVATVEDFGTQGERPSHPALLDWLAADFMDNGWNIKRLHRQILNSASYRQTSRVTPAKQEADPDNRWYARGPRYRLSAWMIRDQALAASGLLVDNIGGPPVKPYQPDGVWSDFTFGKKKYRPDSGSALYRRSLYTFWRRIIGPTMFFDNAKRQTCVVKSARTNTPLHALATLNDITYIEAARALAERVMLEHSDPELRIETAFHYATGRAPTETERGILLARLRTNLQAFRDAPENAKALLSEGESDPHDSLEAPEHAAYTTICNLILNLDETLSKQ